MHETSVVVVGAGQAGLAMSWHLRERAIEHVVLERASVGHSWANERWDSLRLLTPNWLSRLPGAAYDGADPDGYMLASEFADRLRCYGADAPVVVGASVEAVRTTGTGFEVKTSSQGTWSCRSVVVAAGACSQPFVPAVADQFPPALEQITSTAYRNPAQLSDGPVLIVGASASGAQLADELARSGRAVTLAVGRHRRMIRQYRDRDIFWWMEQMGMLDDTPDADDPDRQRRLPSLQLIGTPQKLDLDLGTLVANGVRLVGRIESVSGAVAELGDSVPVDARETDVELNAVLDRIDRYVDEQAMADECGPAVRPRPISVPELPKQLDLSEFSTVIWATGFRPHLPWLEDDLLDARGAIVHDCGVMTRPGMFVTGMPFGLRRRSGFIDGAGPDAHDLAALITDHLAVCP